MWLSRKNSSNSTSSPRTPSSNFNRHSFKNIEDLLGDDDPDSSDLNKDQLQLQKQKQPTSPSSPISSTPATARRHAVFHRVRLANQFTRSLGSTRPKPTVHEKSQSQLELNNATPPQKWEASVPSSIRIPGAEKKIVVYLTSLRVVRPTFEACRTVRSILTGFRVAVDERDLSMDSTFKDELQKIMSQGGDVIPKDKISLPRVFIGGRYVGDAEDLRQLNETGELKKIVEGLPAVSRGVCEGCGDFRFIICSDCNGSRKCYKEKGGLRSCTTCNKNGLVRCPTCWTVKS